MTDLQSRLQEALTGRYLVERQVGQGGMGVVFLAQDLRHHRPVAIKVMRPELAEAVDASRFVREIMTAAQMTHPGILPVHDSGSHDGLMYFVMPYVDGGSLRALLEHQVQLPLDQALRFTTELGEALAYAHAQGVVHRDLKPENVLLEEGRPVIADFGVARAIGDDGDGAHDATYGMAVGTPHYMSPEQAMPTERVGAALRAVRALAAEAPRTKATYNLAIEAWEDGHLQEAKEALERLTPEVGEMRDFLPYWGALATVHHLLGEYGEALEVARRAERVHPGKLFPVGWELAALAALGRTEEVTARSADLVHEPADIDGWTPALAIAEGAGELRAHGNDVASRTAWEAALEWYRLNDVDTEPSLRDRLRRAEALYALGRYDEAEPATRALLSAVPEEIDVLGLHGRIAGRRGDTATAEAVQALLLALGERPYDFGRSYYQAALIAAVLDDEGQALHLLRRAREQGRSYGHWIHRETDLANVRGTRAFQLLVKPVPAQPRG